MKNNCFFASIFLCLAFHQGVLRAQIHDEYVNNDLQSTYSAAIQELKSIINQEMTDNSIPSITITLVKGDQVVWSSAFGYSDQVTQKPASLNTVYRVGSISKLFTAIAIMQRVESGVLDLDMPINSLLENFAVENPYDKKITVRHLITHRSGLVREPPIGSYFDATEPGLSQTVASINKTKLVYEPGSKTKYSNAGVAVLGYMLEILENRPFPNILSDEILAPLQMSSSSFTFEDRFEPHLAKGIMWTIDGKEFTAPKFELGESPAGSMYSTVGDLGLFMSALLKITSGEESNLVRPETFKAMLVPQFVDAASKWKTGTGIGFSLRSDFAGRLRARHGGGIYGFSAELSMLPEDNLGVAILSSKGSISDVISNISNTALRMMLAVEHSNPLPEFKATNMSNRRLIEAIKTLEGTTGKSGSTKGLGGLTGKFGFDHNPLSFYEHEGDLYVHIEYFHIYKLIKVSDSRFRFSHSGLYSGEDVVFYRDASGLATKVAIGGENGVMFIRN